MKRQSRLSSGKAWLEKYEGSNVVKSYAIWYGVNRLCALVELKQLGLEITDEQIEYEKRVEENRAINKGAAKSRKKEEKEEECFADSDEYFSFIAGYTSGGVPYGTTWEEEEELSS